MTLDRKEWRSRIKVEVLVCDIYSLMLFTEPHFSQYFIDVIISLDSLMPSLSDGPLKFPIVVEPNAEEMQNPTTTEVVSAIVYKCAAIAGANISNGNDSSSQMVLVFDLRKTIPPSIKSPSTIGNILTAFSTPIYNLEDLRLPKLVADIRKSKHELSTRDNFKENKWISEMVEYANKLNTGTEDDQSSVCNIPFQDLDFGWGRPTRASIASTPFSNMIYLMNTQDQNRGIEVFINLNQQQMSIFEQDKEFLQFASPVGDNVHEDKEKLYCMEAF
ncbi:hypothetical protein H5410_058357 [Solanum commersonii]|uniref:Uncharacterized protein n=1 Tax=Solanum commersonii TaxID=4109 RepID=A0A9J5WSI6_SOLCO|nr:hypothetical protein H5410_058357 [Solanum commersonii]